jgi:hypothetical protein
MESVIKDSSAIMKIEEDRTSTGDGDATVDSDATVPLPDDTSVGDNQILIEWIYGKWKCFFRSVDELLVELPNHEDNPIVRSEKAQRLEAILCKTLKSEIRSTHKFAYDFQVFWEAAITSATKEEDD